MIIKVIRAVFIISFLMIVIGVINQTTPLPISPVAQQDIRTQTVLEPYFTKARLDIRNSLKNPDSFDLVNK